ncbi:hypothetical protein NLG97_g8005 [Lecanicillium saksenae]|uniref:Uncharacterized protein n=1 Tax=Lecanicillium saksenae TaxID=468837 RepID=A0ACC1QLH7_9HYPO|nr:hypothetical protein NLG97_g8005 [Lecanicillium saksenae]
MSIGKNTQEEPVLHATGIRQEVKKRFTSGKIATSLLRTLRDGAMRILACSKTTHFDLDILVVSFASSPVLFSLQKVYPVRDRPAPVAITRTPGIPSGSWRRPFFPPEEAERSVFSVTIVGTLTTASLPSAVNSAKFAIEYRKCTHRTTDGGDARATRTDAHFETRPDWGSEPKEAPQG